MWQQLSLLRKSQQHSASAAKEYSTDATFEFRRNATAFEAIFDFLQTGELHSPPQLCPRQFACELEFWDVSLRQLHSCCYSSMALYLFEQHMATEFLKKVEEFKSASRVADRYISTSNGSFPSRLWRLTVDPFYSTGSKVQLKLHVSSLSWPIKHRFVVENWI
jgi:hypothetical protein